MKTYKFIILLSLVICFVSLIFVPDVSWGQLPANAQVYVTINGDTFEGSIYADNIQLLSPAASYGGGAKTLMAELKEISVTKGLDISSPVLRRYALKAQILPNIVFDFKEPGYTKPAYTVTLKNAIIQEVSVKIAGSGTNEKVVFALPEKVCWTYYVEPDAAVETCCRLQVQRTQPARQFNALSRPDLRRHPDGGSGPSGRIA